MAEFMFQLELLPFQQEMTDQIPAQIQYVNDLFVQGIMKSYSVAGNRSMIWCVVEADTEQEAMDVVAKLPLYPYCHDVVHHILLVHHNQQYALPDISLN